ncbi:hypothetical protein [Streptococcus mutans]|nr:hypothetical protein [Streptococcus mutans]EMC37884.1 hypothetical protein SMU94_07283 [Streptococcus mutans 66-2A]MCB5116092.1 hypothetical protein [Streptococcus mutans]MDW5543590.1 hypothetical protein [Streptococcus mutans]MDW5547248.1 hypothetical protein [Streptococcus mutans]
MKEQIKEMMPIIEFDEITSDELNGWGSYALGVAVGAGGSLAVAVTIT